jgi:hypothetical protein
MVKKNKRGGQKKLDASASSHNRASSSKREDFTRESWGASVIPLRVESAFLGGASALKD